MVVSFGSNFHLNAYLDVRLRRQQRPNGEAQLIYIFMAQSSNENLGFVGL